MKGWTLKICDGLNVLVCFLVARWFFMSYLFSYSIEIFQLRPGELLTTLVMGILILVMTAFGFVLLRFFYLKKINTNHMIFLYFLYFILLFYSLFLKNIGLQGYEINPLTYFDGLAYGYWFEPVMNLLLFIPIGFLFKGSWKRILIAAIGLMAVEILQYVLHLGIFDLGDFLANFVSLGIGQLIRWILLHLGFRQWLS